MDQTLRQAVSKVPEVTLGFWVVKVIATTLGETGGDSVTMTLGLGHGAVRSMSSGSPRNTFEGANQ